MITTRRAWLLLALLALLCQIGAGAQTETVVKLPLVPTGVGAKMGNYNRISNRRLLSLVQPASVKTLPNVDYGEFTEFVVGLPEHPTPVVVLVDAPDGVKPKLYLDSSGKGDLSHIPAQEMTLNRAAQRPNEPDIFAGDATVPVVYDGKPVPLHLDILLLRSPKPGHHAALPDVLLYTADYARVGNMSLGGETYSVMLTDPLATGDWRIRPRQQQPQSGIRLLIDVNHNGIFEDRGESYDISQPFNIKGVTYEVASISPTGDSFVVRKSNQRVPEILPPPNLKPGMKSLPFIATTLDGHSVHFPAAYKGRLVLLYFWASWCPDCNRELPNVVQAYARFHSRGLDILGISLDKPDTLPQLRAFLQAKGMTWPEVYDGKYFKAEVAGLYYVHSIPSAYLVDGDTGIILAMGQDVLAAKLAPTIESALLKKPVVTSASH